MPRDPNGWPSLRKRGVCADLRDKALAQLAENRVAIDDAGAQAIVGAVGGGREGLRHRLVRGAREVCGDRRVIEVEIAAVDDEIATRLHAAREVRDGGFE